MYTILVSFVACNYETRQAQPIRSLSATSELSGPISSVNRNTHRGLFYVKNFLGLHFAKAKILGFAFDQGDFLKFLKLLGAKNFS